MNRARPKIAVLASGSGTTFEAFVHATQAGILDAEVGLLIHNNSDTGVVKKFDRLKRMYRLDMERVHISNETHPDPEGIEVPRGAVTLAAAEAIAECASEEDFAVRIMLGYMKRLREPALSLEWMNSHPGLLPATKGLWGPNVHQFVYDEGHAETGHTLHWAEEEYDAGAEIAHRTIPIMPFDDPESIGEAVQASERIRVPRFVQSYLHD